MLPKGGAQAESPDGWMCFSGTWLNLLASSGLVGEAPVDTKRLAAANTARRMCCMSSRKADTGGFSGEQTEVRVYFRADGPYILLHSTHSQTTSLVGGHYSHA